MSASENKRLSRGEALKSVKPQLLVDLTLYPTDRGGRRGPAAPGWGCPCTIHREEWDGQIFHDGWPLLGDTWIAPGETRQVGFFFLLEKEAMDYLKGVSTFYLWEGRIVGEAKIIKFENSN